jgi:hypothetical protein
VEIRGQKLLGLLFLIAQYSRGLFPSRSKFALAGVAAAPEEWIETKPLTQREMGVKQGKFPFIGFHGTPVTR